jgi:CRP-like cAMP-binding protein
MGPMTNFCGVHLAGRVVNNRILSSMSAAGLAELIPHLQPMELRRDQVLHQPDGRPRHVHFIQKGLVVFTKMMRDGRSTMIASAGVEGMSVPNILNGNMRPDIECCVHVEGSSLAIDIDLLERRLHVLPILHRLLRRYAVFMEEQIAQLSGCNRLHSLEQRCARMLLTVHDSVNAHAFAQTHESLALVLGAQRPHVSAVAANFQTLQLIQYKHGQLRVTNPAGLKSLCCECYGFIREHTDATFDHRFS